MAKIRELSTIEHGLAEEDKIVKVKTSIEKS